MNQGQSYEVKLKMFGDTEERDIQMIVHVMFHECRLQYIERKQMDCK